jgi:hypothetical protein
VSQATAEAIVFVVLIFAAIGLLSVVVVVSRGFA